MGNFSSFASQAFQALGTVSSVISAADQYANRSGQNDYKAQKRANEIAMMNAQEEAALKRQQIGLDAQKAETERRAALRRAMAKQKAVYGASGTDSSSGSAQAVLLGKVNITDDDRRQSEALDALKNANIDQSLANIQRANTLQLTQLKERDKYNKYTAATGLAQSMADILK